MRLLKIYQRPDLRGVEYAVLISHRDVAEFHQLAKNDMNRFEIRKIQAKFKADLIDIVKEHTCPTARVRWAKKARRKRRAIGV